MIKSWPDKKRQTVISGSSELSVREKGRKKKAMQRRKGVSISEMYEWKKQKKPY